jgi:ankyrin repeat protein
MKKSVIILSTAFVLFTNASITANCKSFVKDQLTFTVYSESPLHIAISKGDIEIVKKYIEYGDDVKRYVTVNGSSTIQQS